MTNENKKPTFWGVELNEEEIKYHRLSYRTMAKQFDAVLCNNIVEVDPYIFDNLESGDFMRYFIDGEETTREEYEEKKEEIENEIENLEDYLRENDLSEQEENKVEEQIKDFENLLETFEENEVEIYQYYLVDSSALWYLERANELVFYSDKLDCYIWAVDHWGTGWDYVMTSLRISEDFSHLED